MPSRWLRTGIGEQPVLHPLLLNGSEKTSTSNRTYFTAPRGKPREISFDSWLPLKNSPSKVEDASRAERFYKVCADLKGHSASLRPRWTRKRLFVGGFCTSRDTRDDVYAGTVFKKFRDPRLLTGKLRGHYPVTHLTRSNYRACFARPSQVRNSHPHAGATPKGAIVRLTSGLCRSPLLREQRRKFADHIHWLSSFTSHHAEATSPCSL
jgi:hypothetical protein